MDGEVVAGVVYDVVRDELFAATLGGGRDPRRRADRPVRRHRAGPLPLVATGSPTTPTGAGRQAEVLVRVLPHVRDIRRFGAAAVDLCSVACGRVDAYYERGLAPGTWPPAA